MFDTGICMGFQMLLHEYHCNCDGDCDCVYDMPYLATNGVSPTVTGARTGISALLHRKASARDELGPVRRLLNHPLSLGSASSWTCWSACSFHTVRHMREGCQRPKLHKSIPDRSPYLISRLWGPSLFSMAKYKPMCKHKKYQLLCQTSCSF